MTHAHTLLTLAVCVVGVVHAVSIGDAIPTRLDVVNTELLSVNVSLVAVGDYEGDGYDDICAIVCSDGVKDEGSELRTFSINWYSYVPEKDSYKFNTSVPMNQWSSRYKMVQMDLSDVDGDGLLDVVYMYGRPGPLGVDYTQMVIYAYRSSVGYHDYIMNVEAVWTPQINTPLVGSSTWTQQGGFPAFSYYRFVSTWRPLRAATHNAQFAMGDINGDSRADLFVQAANNIVQRYEYYWYTYKHYTPGGAVDSSIVKSSSDWIPDQELYYPSMVLEVRLGEGDGDFSETYSDVDGFRTYGAYSLLVGDMGAPNGADSWNTVIGKVPLHSTDDMSYNYVPTRYSFIQEWYCDQEAPLSPSRGAMGVNSRDAAEGVNSDEDAGMDARVLPSSAPTCLDWDIESVYDTRVIGGYVFFDVADFNGDGSPDGLQCVGMPGDDVATVEISYWWGSPFAADNVYSGESDDYTPYVEITREKGTFSAGRPHVSACTADDVNNDGHPDVSYIVVEKDGSESLYVAFNTGKTKQVEWIPDSSTGSASTAVNTRDEPVFDMPVRVTTQKEYTFVDKFSIREATTRENTDPNVVTHIEYISPPGSEYAQVMVVDRKNDLKLMTLGYAPVFELGKAQDEPELFAGCPTLTCGVPVIVSSSLVGCCLLAAAIFGIVLFSRSRTGAGGGKHAQPATNAAEDEDATAVLTPYEGDPRASARASLATTAKGAPPVPHKGRGSTLDSRPGSRVSTKPGAPPPPVKSRGSTWAGSQAGSRASTRPGGRESGIELSSVAPQVHGAGNTTVIVEGSRYTDTPTLVGSSYTECFQSSVGEQTKTIDAGSALTSVPSLDAPTVSGCGPLQLCARGGQATLYTTLCFDLGVRIACKVFDTEAEFERERDVLTAIPPHDNIVGVIELRDSPPLTIGFELAALGSLKELVMKTQLTEPNALCVGLDIARGLEHLHKHGISHLDVKPDNVLLFKKGEAMTAKLCDFGTSFLVGRSDFRVTACTIKYAAPEVLCLYPPPLPNISILSYTSLDVYSFGVLLWQLLTNFKPHGDADNDDVLALTRANPLSRVDTGLISNSRARDLVNVCLLEAKKRPDDMGVVVGRLEKLVNTYDANESMISYLDY